jgi:hypothetical protein
MVVSDVQNFDVLVFISLACVLLACSIFTVWATKSSGGACCRERNIEMLLEQMVRRRAAPPLPSCLLSFLIPSLLLLAAAVATAALRSPPHTVFGNTVCVVIYLACVAFDSHLPPPLPLRLISQGERQEKLEVAFVQLSELATRDDAAESLERGSELGREEEDDL